MNEEYDVIVLGTGLTVSTTLTELYRDVELILNLLTAAVRT